MKTCDPLVSRLGVCASVKVELCVAIAHKFVDNDGKEMLLSLISKPGVCNSYKCGSTDRYSGCIHATSTEGSKAKVLKQWPSYIVCFLCTEITMPETSGYCMLVVSAVDV